MKVDDHENKGYTNKLNISETCEMLIAKYVIVEDNLYIAVGLYGGFKLWAKDGSRLFFNIPCKVDNKEKLYAFTTITEYNNIGIICGDNYGQVFLVNYSNNNWKSKIIYSFSGFSVTSLAANNKGNICVGFETGKIFILENPSNTSNNECCKVLSKFDDINNLPVTTLVTIEFDKVSYFIGSFVNGQVKIYVNNNDNNFSSDLIFTLSAHLRNINSLISYKNYFITAGDDCFINIWKLNNEKEISLIESIETTDKMPIGLEYDINNKLLLIAFFDTLSLSSISIDLK